jgi:hypothetical protein
MYRKVVIVSLYYFLYPLTNIGNVFMHLGA